MVVSCDLHPGYKKELISFLHQLFIPHVFLSSRSTDYLKRCLHEDFQVLGPDFYRQLPERPEVAEILRPERAESTLKLNHSVRTS